MSTSATNEKYMTKDVHFATRLLQTGLVTARTAINQANGRFRMISKNRCSCIYILAKDWSASVRESCERRASDSLFDTADYSTKAETSAPTKDLTKEPGNRPQASLGSYAYTGRQQRRTPRPRVKAQVVTNEARSLSSSSSMYAIQTIDVFNLLPNSIYSFHLPSVFLP
jgi:hypothetical protein